MSVSRLVLLLTATIDPGQTPMVARRDSQTRLNDYCEALRIWLGSGVRTIVFVENSGHDLSVLEKIAAEHPKVRTEFISLATNAAAGRLGKGYGELTMIEAAFLLSPTLRHAQHVAKCTGRLTLINAAKMLRCLEGSQADMYCTFKSSLTFADSRFFIARPSIFTQQLASKKALLNDNAGTYFENVLARAAAEAVSQGFRWAPFPTFPYIAGISGTFGTRMTDRLWTRVAKVIYHAVRRYIYQH